MTTIKYWAMHHKLSGSGDRNVMINNYAICLLVIFYLQSENILPSVKKLQQNMDAAESVSIKIKGKKVAYGFPNDLSKWRGNEMDLSENSKSLTELLYGFFDFYANFDYLNSIISPNTGQIIPRLVLSCQITIFYSRQCITRSLLDKLYRFSAEFSLKKLKVLNNIVLIMSGLCDQYEYCTRKKVLCQFFVCSLGGN